MIFYLEPETGDDANDGLTEATAVKTMKRALAIGYEWLERQTPRFNPDGSYDGPTVLITCESNRRLHLAGLPMKECP